ncbi:MAG TPA: hypothetical protein VGT44_10005 [Ktedonobacteraceae bacterium]|nr:hypothetical protein [Ktedonobacteraceae bacterium]
MIRTHRARRERESRAGEGAAQVVVGVAVAAGKLRAGQTENLPHLGGRPTPPQQIARDPAVHDAPVGLGEALADVPSLHTGLIEFGGNGGGDRIVKRRGRWRRRYQGAGRAQQGFSLQRHNGLRADDLDPGGVAAPCAPRGLLVGEAGESAQVTPVGAGRIATISRRQELAGGAGQRRFQRRGAETNPGLQMSGAGLQDHAGVMSVGVHGGDGRRPCVIQIDKDVASILVASVGLHIDVTAFAVAHAQEADGSRRGQLFGSPEPFAGERPPSLVVNQANQIEVVGHGCQLSANGLQGEKETVVFHDRNIAVETNRRTMNFQRTANCVLTVCLSRGGRRNAEFRHQWR